jgi:hypothetical protein
MRNVLPSKSRLKSSFLIPIFQPSQAFIFVSEEGRQYIIKTIRYVYERLITSREFRLARYTAVKSVEKLSDVSEEHATSIFRFEE